MANVKYAEITEKQKAIILKMEGGLYVDISMLSILGNSWSISKSHYAVIDGIVYAVGNGKMQKTGDELHNITASCKRIGKYSPNKVYKDIVRQNLTYKQIKKLFRL